jgi:LPXTG-motif cell wall-anchored protein
MNRSTLRSIAGAALALSGAALLGLGATVAHAAATLPADNNLYAIGCADTNDFQLYEVSSTGELTAIGDGTGSDDFYDCVPQAAWDWSTGLAYFSWDGDLYSMDVATGDSTLVAALTGDFAESTVSIAIGRNGESYAIYDCKVATINLTNGATQFLSGYQTNCDGGFYYFAPFAYNADNDTYYSINADNTEDDTPPIANMIYPVNKNTGAIFGTTGAEMTGVNFSLDDNLVDSYRTMSFDSNGVGWLIWDSGSVGALYSFDATTGNLTYEGLIADGGTYKSVQSTFLKSPAPAALADTGIDNSGLGTMAGFAAVLMVGSALLFVLRRRVLNP